MKRGPLYWLGNVLLGLDETANAILAGDGHHTLSARVGYAAWRGKAWARRAARIVDALMGSDRHCHDAAVSEGLIPPPEGDAR